jgi:hypothetical protein
MCEALRWIDNGGKIGTTDEAFACNQATSNRGNNNENIQVHNATRHNDVGVHDVGRI